MQIISQKIRPIGSLVLLIMVTFFCQPSPVGGAPIVNTDKDIYNYGETIKVNFLNSPGYERDWICIVPAGSPDNVPGNYKYMPQGLNQGILTFNSPSPGKYEVRAYYNYRQNGYVVSARHGFSVVAGGPPGKSERLSPAKETDVNFTPAPKLSTVQDVTRESPPPRPLQSKSVLNRKVDLLTVTGFGEHEGDARRDAIKKAVEQAIGMYVVSDQISKNDEVIKDQILSQSNGYVIDFLVLDKGQDANGLFFIRADVTVESTRLTKRLGELNVGLKDLGTEKYKAVTESVYAAKADFRNVVEATVYDPLRTNQVAYKTDIIQIKIVELSSLANRKIEWFKDDQQRAKLGDLQPVLIRFRHGLSPQYQERLLTMMKKTSFEKSTIQGNDEFTNQMDKFFNSRFTRPATRAGAAYRGKEEEQSLYMISLVEPSLKSEMNKNYIHQRSQRFQINQRSQRSQVPPQIGFKVTDKFFFLPDQGQIFKALHETFMREYRPVTQITLTASSGGAPIMLIYDSGRGRNRNIKRDEKRVSATSNFVMEMEFGNETLIFDLQHNSDIVNNGLNSKFPAFCIQSPVKQVVVFLERDALVNMKDVQVDTVWVKH